MSEPESEGESSAKPAPPLIPPEPPPPELLRSVVPHVPLTPMMDFLQRRLETLEKELGAERDRAQAAQNLLAQQDTMRSEVEASLKNLHEQLRREKAERETESEKSHARGRIDSLEKRLDEMHKTWAALLKDAVTRRDDKDREAADTQAALGQEVRGVAQGLHELQAHIEVGRSQSAGAAHEMQTHIEVWRAQSAGATQELQARIEAWRAQSAEAARELQTQIEAWRAQSAEAAQSGATLGQFARELPERTQRVLSQLQDRLGTFVAEVADRLSSWEQRQAQESERQELRLSQLGRERAALQKQWEEANHAVRREFLQERIAREEVLAGNIADICRRLDAATAGQAQAETEASQLKGEIAKVLTLLSTPPQAKDAVIAELEREKSELLMALRDRSDALAKYMTQRREVEKTMGAGLLDIHSRLDAERDRCRELQGRVAELEIGVKAAQDQADQAVADRDRSSASLTAERDALARSLVAESEKVRPQVEARVQAESAWTARLQETHKRLEAELARGSELSATVAELRAQIATLTEHMTKALQDKDAVVNRFGAWSQEREKLLQNIHEKDEMISMLSSTFQGMLKKE